MTKPEERKEMLEQQKKNLETSFQRVIGAIELCDAMIEELKQENEDDTEKNKNDKSNRKKRK